jgi:hypothetical protein
LLDVALVVLVRDTAAGEREPFRGAIRHQLVIDELASVIRVDPTQREGKHATRSLQRMYDTVLRPVQQRQALGPRGGYVGQRQCV